MLNRLAAWLAGLALLCASPAMAQSFSPSGLSAGSAVGASDVFIADQGTCPQATTNLPPACKTLGVLGSQIQTFAQSGLIALTLHGDSNYVILSTDRYIATSAALTASRTWTLPAANSVKAGQLIRVADQAGGIAGADTLVIARAGSDTINGGSTSVTLATAFSGIDLISDGTSQWTVVGGSKPFTAPAHQFLTGSSPLTGQAAAQPAFTDISGSVAATQMPALTGDTTTSAGSVATTTTKINGTTPGGSCAAHTWDHTLSSSAVPSCTQPASTDLSDAVARTTFTPTIDFATHGDLSVAYTTQQGAYLKVGGQVCVWYSLVFTPTFTTSSGAMIISAPPVAPTDSNVWGFAVSALASPTWTASATTIGVTWNGSNMVLQGFKSAGAAANFGTVQIVTGVQVTLKFSGCYF